MALDFPNSPTNGEYYEGFVWDSTAGVWRATKDPAFTLVDFLLIGGGGGGVRYDNDANWGGGGGGGAGGYLTSYGTSGGLSNALQPLALNSGDSLIVTIGNGGTDGVKGEDSVLGSLVAYGGGASSVLAQVQLGASGGGGVGGTGFQGIAGTNLANQGFAGGNGFYIAGTRSHGGGGGGAGGVGTTAEPGQGGPGIASTITGSSVTRAVGGNGALGTTTVSNGGTSAAANTGSGGEGAQYRTAGSGGSGLVVLRFKGSGSFTVGAGLTYSTSTVSGDTVYTFTAGSDTITLV